MRVEVPKFADYSGVIQANQAMSNAFKQLGDTSQDYLNYSEQKSQNIADNQHKANIFEETKKANQLNADKFTNEINNENAKKQANALTFQTLYPEQSQKFNSQFSGDLSNGMKMSDILGNVDLGTYNTNRQFEYTKDSDTQKRLYDIGRDEVKDKQWGQEFGFRQGQANKPDYQKFEGVDAQGNPTLYYFDKNTGKVINTGQQVYQAAKELSPEQKLYYMDRSNEMQQKTLAATKKAFMESPAYSKMNEQDQLKAIEYIDTNGKAPQISFDGSWNGKGYYMPMSDAVKQEKQKQLEQDMKTLGL